jgi:CRP/FNR family transcriptional regulator, cyclic AMP receptor protein
METKASKETLATTIAEHRLFKDLAPRYLALLAEVAMFKEFAADEVIFREGDPANRFYLILDGEVALESARRDGPSVLLQAIGRDDVLGWSWLFPPYYWHFDARATVATKAIFFYGTWLRESCERDHDFGYEMMKRMSAIIIARLQATRKKLAEAEAKL